MRAARFRTILFAVQEPAFSADMLDCFTVIWAAAFVFATARLEHRIRAAANRRPEPDVDPASVPPPPTATRSPQTERTGSDPG